MLVSDNFAMRCSPIIPMFLLAMIFPHVSVIVKLHFKYFAEAFDMVDVCLILSLKIACMLKEAVMLMLFFSFCDVYRMLLISVTGP